jgi:hypothetical protein
MMPPKPKNDWKRKPKVVPAAEYASQGKAFPGLQSLKQKLKQEMTEIEGGSGVTADESGDTLTSTDEEQQVTDGSDRDKLHSHTVQKDRSAIWINESIIAERTAKVAQKAKKEKKRGKNKEERGGDGGERGIFSRTHAGVEAQERRLWR